MRRTLKRKRIELLECSLCFRVTRISAQCNNIKCQKFTCHDCLGQLSRQKWLNVKPHELYGEPLVQFEWDKKSILFPKVLVTLSKPPQLERITVNCPYCSESDFCSLFPRGER